MYIFLDIDGILATDKEFMSSTKEFHKKYPVAKELRIPYRFNEGCVKVFNSILKETNAEIIISSDWRLKWNLQELNRIFMFNKVIKSPIGVTDNDPISIFELENSRANEIEDFIYDNNISNYVILDDLNLSPFLEFSQDNFVHCPNSNEGIKQVNIKNKVLKLLLPNTVIQKS